MSSDSGVPLVYVPGKLYRESGVKYTYGGDEHGALTGDIGHYKIGDRVHLIPGHCDPTVNMHSYFVCVRKGIVEEIWPISARGPGI